jgi:hypothetical protein
MGEAREEGCGVKEWERRGGGVKWGVEKVRSLGIWGVGKASRERKRGPSVNLNKHASTTITLQDCNTR